ncbi:MAG: hypothetical protein ACFFEF_12400 [Candidatus Thorarchaeota archaeon]
MNMSRKIGVAVISIVFLVALVSAVPVEAKKDFSVYRWWTVFNYTESPEWTGEIWTEGTSGGEHGTMYWDNDDDAYRFLGPDGESVQKFSGIWWIIWDSGATIKGTHKGSWSYATVTPIINGRITEATGEWSYLEGRIVHTDCIIYLETFTIDGYFVIN